VKSLLVAAAVTAFAAGCTSWSADPDDGGGGRDAARVHYLEIVTHDVDAVCAAYARANGLEFGDPVAELGQARTAARLGGGVVGVRGPLRASEEPVVRPYWLVDDIERAVDAAVSAGAEIAHPPLEIPGHGVFAIYILGGVQHGLWQLTPVAGQDAEGRRVGGR
jgi:hypothetical protein